MKRVGTDIRATPSLAPTMVKGFSQLRKAASPTSARRRPRTRAHSSPLPRLPRPSPSMFMSPILSRRSNRSQPPLGAPRIETHCRDERRAAAATRLGFWPPIRCQEMRYCPRACTQGKISISQSMRELLQGRGKRTWSTTGPSPTEADGQTAFRRWSFRTYPQRASVFTIFPRLLPPPSKTIIKKLSTRECFYLFFTRIYLFERSKARSFECTRSRFP